MTKKLTVVQMLPELDGGGVERGTLEIGKYLVDHGHKSIVISGSGRMVEQLVQEGSEHIDWQVGKKSLSTLCYVKKVRNFLRKTQPDILHLRSRLPAWIGYLAWKKLPESNRPKLVTTVHGRYSVNKYSGVMVRGEKVIAVSEMIRKYILNNYAVNPDAIQVIYRGVDTREYEFGFMPDENWQERWFKEFSQTKGAQILTLPGRLTRLKGHEDFIKIISALVDSGHKVHGLIVGGVHPKKKQYEEELKKQIAELDLKSHITFTGHRNDLKEIISISTIIYSLSSVPESFGRTTLEALSIGRPVIGYSHGGVQEQLEQIFPEGLISVGSIQKAISTTNLFLNKVPILQPQRTFTLDSMCSQTLSIYQELCNG